MFRLLSTARSLSIQVRKAGERRVDTPLHIYYVFYSRLLASCREAMTEYCGLAAELFYSIGSTTGDL
ncbi:MAG: hypothetical protein V7L02_06095 [Nostoc sp.]|uniref:hypothetical protein n=1 Tax=Nostoc sp. TaxID=1180 RepID=UPI002FFA0FDD